MFDPADADALQHAWLLPFEFVDMTPELDSAAPAVVADDGTLFLPTAGRGMAEQEVAEAPPSLGPGYAYAIAARAGDREHALGSDERARAAAAETLARSRGRQEAWLLRVKTAGGGSEPFPLRGPEPVRPRRVREGPVAVLLDFGMVLARFDRSLLAPHFRSVFGQPPPGPGLALMERLRPALERGEILADEFLDRILGPLGLVRPDRDALARVWTSIISLKRSTTALVRQLAARPHTAVVVVSQTDPIMLRHVREDLGLGELTECLVASCMDGVNSKGEDASLWERARYLAEARLDAPPEAVIAVDDVRAWLQRPLAAGIATHGIHYRNCGQFKYELGALGLYLPLRRGAPDPA